VKCRERRLQEIFNKLDTDRDGFISHDLINLETLSSPILDILTPFFLFLEREKKTLTLVDFCEVLNKDYIPALSVKEKHTLFQSEKEELI